MVLPSPDDEGRTVFGYLMQLPPVLQNRYTLKNLKVLILAHVEVEWWLLLEELLTLCEIKSDIKREIPAWVIDYSCDNSPIET